MHKGNEHAASAHSETADSGLWLFLKEIINNPSAMGAACPSSKRLAQCISAQIPKCSGLIIELGAGTGVITEAILNSGVEAKQLLPVERSPAMAQHLRERFPQLQIIQGDASGLQNLIGVQHPPISAIVSGLPLRSLPADMVSAIGRQMDNILDPDTIFIQFTYSLHRAPFSPSPQLVCTYKEYIWRNLPPARVDVFRQAS